MKNRSSAKKQIKIVEVSEGQVLLVFAWQADKIYTSGIEFELFGLSPLKRIELKRHMGGAGSPSEFG